MVNNSVVVSIHEGDTIIASGNLNLADGTEVKLNNKE